MRRETLYGRMVRMGVRGRGVWTIDEIRRMTPISRDSLHVMLHRWTRAGRLERPARGVYSLAGVSVSPAALTALAARREPSRDMGDISKHILGSMAALRVRRSIRLEKRDAA
ncbi:type IV toxin-antitoxin system AbiEi family antitoxin domain-containing protein [bacterium]|nr:type IV toxin-antitoxin system AbiEi family antitoxin domain-containing protein [bacterium]